MHVSQPSSFGDIGSVGEVTSSQLPSPPESMDPSDLSPIRKEALELLKPDVRQARILCFAIAGALTLGFGLGWTGSSSWYGVPTVVALNPTAQKDSSPGGQISKPTRLKMSENKRRLALQLQLRPKL